MKRKLVLIFAVLLAVSSLYASPEFMMGGGFTSGRDYVTQGMKASIKDNPYYSNGNLEFLTFLGPSYEMAFFPYAAVKVGPYISGATSFILNRDGSYYRSYNWDLRQDLGLGIAWHQFFGGNSGLYVDLAWNWEWYRLAESNVQNTRLEPDWSKYSENSILLGFGCVIDMESSYFKAGFSFRKPVANEFNDGWKLDMTASGGFKF